MIEVLLLSVLLQFTYNYPYKSHVVWVISSRNTLDYVAENESAANKAIYSFFCFCSIIVCFVPDLIRVILDSEHRGTDNRHLTHHGSPRSNHPLLDVVCLGGPKLYGGS